MKNNLCRWMLCLTVVAPILAQGAAANPLPAPVAVLVPVGAQVSSPIFGKTPAYAEVGFDAEKKLPGNHKVNYSFHLLTYDTNSPLWKIRAPIYQADMASKIDAKRQSFTTASNPPISYDPVKVVKYSWGTGFTQRVVHHYIGAGSGPDYVDYRAAYVGMIGGAMFELSVNGVKTAEETDLWAKTVAAKAGGLTLANMIN